MIFTVISFIGLVVLYFCCNFGPLKGKLFSLKLLKTHNIIVGHCIAILIIIVLMTILFILCVHEVISGMY